MCVFVFMLQWCVVMCGGVVCVCMCCEGGEERGFEGGMVGWKVSLTQHTDRSQGCLLLAIVQHGSYLRLERYLYKVVICVLSLPNCS